MTRNESLITRDDDTWWMRFRTYPPHGVFSHRVRTKRPIRDAMVPHMTSMPTFSGR